jgi:hypothetical protein
MLVAPLFLQTKKERKPGNNTGATFRNLHGAMADNRICFDPLHRRKRINLYIGRAAKELRVTTIGIRFCGSDSLELLFIH